MHQAGRREMTLEDCESILWSKFEIGAHNLGSFSIEKLIYVALHIRRLGKVAKAWAKREEEMGLMNT